MLNPAQISEANSGFTEVAVQKQGQTQPLHLYGPIHRDRIPCTLVCEQCVAIHAAVSMLFEYSGF